MTMTVPVTLFTTSLMSFPEDFHIISLLREMHCEDKSCLLFYKEENCLESNTDDSWVLPWQIWVLDHGPCLFQSALCSGIFPSVLSSDVSIHQMEKLQLLSNLLCFALQTLSILKSLFCCSFTSCSKILVTIVCHVGILGFHYYFMFSFSKDWCDTNCLYLNLLLNVP